MADKKYFKIDVYSHFFKVTVLDNIVIDKIKKFAFRLIRYSFEKQNGQWVRIPKKIFATKTQDNKEYRFTLTMLDEFKSFMEDLRITENNYETYTHPLYTPTKVDVGLPKTWVPRDIQVPIIDYVVSEGYIKTITLQTGQGKALPLTTPLKQPNDWVNMGDVKVGDNLITKDGSHTRVTGVYPQGITAICQLVFEDDRTIQACPEHLWEVQIDKGDWEVITTEQIYGLLERQPAIKIYIPLMEAEQSEDIYLPLSPTTYGKALVANGNILPRIDTCYWNGSHTQRLELFMAILQAKFGYGHLVGLDYIKYSSDFNLVKLLERLARSLGGKATVSNKEDYYALTFNLKPADKRLKIISVHRMAPQETQCISVDHPSKLYVAGDYIVTHNTALSLKSAEIIGDRLIIFVLGRYFDKWIGDVEENYNLAPGELLAIRGFKALQNLMQLAYEERIDDCKVIIVTLTSMHDYIKHYESDLNVDLPEWYVAPERLYELLGVGLCITDEAHQHFHLNFLVSLYMHIPKTINLSGTLESDDAFDDRMLRLAYPISTRMAGSHYVKYCRVKNLYYSFEKPKQIRSKGRAGAYSHVVFEQSLMHNKAIMEHYLELIWEVVKTEYLEKKVDKQRMLIFAATVDFCNIITKYIQKRVPHLVVSKYTSDDEYELLMSSDISVSTLGSSGTAVDIEDLLVCLMTTALSNQQANLQAVGRLRQLLKYPKQDPLFIYLTCEDIEKHRFYHEKKVEMLKHKVLSHVNEYYPNKL